MRGFGFGVASGGSSSFINMVAVSIGKDGVGAGFDADMRVTTPGRLRFELKADAESVGIVGDGKLGESIVCVRLADTCL